MTTARAQESIVREDELYGGYGASLASTPSVSRGLFKTYCFRAADWPEAVTATTTETSASGNVLRQAIRKLRVTG